MQQREGVQAEGTAYAKTLKMEGEGMNEITVLQEGAPGRCLECGVHRRGWC